MLAILPFISLFFIFLNIWKNNKLNEISRREAFLIASIIWCVLIILSIEVLNPFRLITFEPVLIFWIFTILIEVIFYSRIFKNNKKLIIVDFNDYVLLEKIMLFIIILYVFLIAVVAFFSSPNTWDSLTCHMTRVAHWIQNHSVNPYPTSMPKQIFYLPGISYVIMHLKILSFSDIAVNFVQYFFMLGSMMGVSLIAKKHFHASRDGQIIASFFTVTIPMGILQATSTRNDYAVAFYLVCFVFFILNLIQKPSLLYAFLAGFSLGLAFLTKGTGYLYPLPLLALYIYRCLVIENRKEIKYLITIISLAILVILGYYMRNSLVDGNFLGTPGMYDEIKTYSMTPKLFLSNIIRNIGTHLGTNIDGLNDFFKQTIINIHEIINVDIRDDRSTLGGG